MSTQRYLIAEDTARPAEANTLLFSSNTPDLRPLYISTARFDQEWAGNRHRHPFVELFYVTAGKGEIYCNGRMLPVRPGDLVVINPRTEHAEYSRKDAPLEYIVLAVKGMELFPSRGGSSDAIHIPGCQSIERYLIALVTEAREQAPGYIQVCCHLTSALMLILLRSSSLQAAPPAPQNSLGFCATVKSYIDAHYKDPLTLDELAELARQNKYYLVHAFTTAYGMSPIKYQIHLRMEESCHLLAETDTSIAEIGIMVGFSAPSHFTQAFKRAMGLTPNAYRRQVQQEHRL